MVNNLPGVWETHIQSLGQEDPLEKEMTSHSSILAWIIHGQKSLVGYSLWSCKRVGHDTKQQQTTYVWVYMYNIPHFVYQLICWLIHGYFYLLTIVYSVAVNAGVQVSESMLSVLLGIYT